MWVAAAARPHQWTKSSGLVGPCMWTNFRSTSWDRFHGIDVAPFGEPPIRTNERDVAPDVRPERQRSGSRRGFSNAPQLSAKSFSPACSPRRAATSAESCSRVRWRPSSSTSWMPLMMASISPSETPNAFSQYGLRQWSRLCIAAAYCGNSSAEKRCRVPRIAHVFTSEPSSTTCPGHGAA